MSSLAAFANLDVDKLIQDIAARPAIWDKNFNGRQNKGYLEELWDELVSFMIHYVENLQNTSRENFSLELFEYFYYYQHVLIKL